VLRFSDIRQAPAGTLVALLSEAYAPLLSLAGDSGRGEMAKWQEFDDLAYSSSVVGRCVFLSWSDDTIAGFGSFDPRGAPQFGTVGHHCVLPSFQRKGFGRLQLQEIVDRLTSSRTTELRASTLGIPFFAPARRIYELLHFEVSGRSAWERDPNVEIVHYMRRSTSGSL
jgi:GNAT superfamily N-acetyltransferase